MTTVLDEPTQTITTPKTRQVFRRSRFWIGVAVFVALVVVGYTLLSPTSPTSQPLAANGTGQTGAGALVSVLREHGVTVTATTSFTSTRAAILDPDHTTLFVYDPSGYLDASQLSRLPRLAARVVVLSPAKRQVRDLDRNISLIGISSPSPSAHCESSAARNAGTISDAGHAYRVASGATNYTKCFPSGDNDYSLVQRTVGTSTLSVVGTTDAFTNRYIADRGNAALAINLLGSQQRLVWYLPSLADVGAGGRTETPAQAAPAWFATFSVLVLLVIIAAAFWRGRRFGPLVIERLPVVVRSSETMEGRARLYQASSARSRALDSLRIGALTRITRSCGLPRTADVNTVMAAVSELTGRPLAVVRDILVDGIPNSDAELVRRSDELIELETAVATATGPPGSREVLSARNDAGAPGRDSERTE
jgi:hypothetical protein